jgi:choline kinase
MGHGRKVYKEPMLKPNGLSIIIPAAGTGKRMKSYGPKPLIELSNRQTILSRQLKILDKYYPDAEVIIVVGFECEQIIRQLPRYVKVVENENYEETNVARSIGMGLRAANSNNNALIVYGDLVFNGNAIKTVVGGESVVVVDNSKRMSDEEVGVATVDGRVTHFNYGLSTKWAQIVFLTGKELEIFRNISTAEHARKWYGFEVLNGVMAGGGKLRTTEPRRMKVVEIDSSRDIEAARRIK